ncbi:MAG: glycosyltransferase family 2 protein [Oscillospiraceae bacterium]|nr:glycosyltransferase family 2 protein [Oscillospiraceae bacterium]
MNLITVFTPTYNRGYSLGDLYHSLQQQTNFCFEWLIVDDGSTDNTEETVGSFLTDHNLFRIRYYKKANGGKHTAINEGVTLAEGSLFFIVDSDDRLSPNAIEKLFVWERTIDDKAKFAGVSGNKGDLNGVLLGETFSGDSIDATNLERKEKNILGDKAEAYYTHILRKFPFPVVDGENFMTESVVWDQIAAAGYKIRWFNEVIYLVEQREDGLIAQGNARYANNPCGYAFFVLQSLHLENANWRDKLYAGFYYYETVKEKVSITKAAKLLHRSIITFSLFWVYQSAKIWLKRFLLKNR